MSASRGGPPQPGLRREFESDAAVIFSADHGRAEQVSFGVEGQCVGVSLYW